VVPIGVGTGAAFTFGLVLVVGLVAFEVGPVPVGDPDGPVRVGDADGPVPVGDPDGPVRVGDADGPVPVGDADGPVPVGDADGPVPVGDADGPVPVGDADGPVPVGDADGDGPVAQLGTVMVSSSRVTAPLRASTRPVMVSPVCTAMEVRAKMVPTNVELVLRVAELPTCQKMLHA
jgi:hypothetical protein